MRNGEAHLATLARDITHYGLSILPLQLDVVLGQAFLPVIAYPDLIPEVQHNVQQAAI